MYTYEFTHFAVTVDNVILNITNRKDPKILLVKRKNYPYKGCWTLPGGFLDVSDIHGEQAASRELFEETNLSMNVYQICTKTHCNRDPRERVISIAYGCLITDKDIDKFPIKAKDDAVEAVWYSLKTLAKDYSLTSSIVDVLAFDHNEIIIEAIYKMIIYNTNATKITLDETYDYFQICKDLNNGKHYQVYTEYKY